MKGSGGRRREDPIVWKTIIQMFREDKFNAFGKAFWKKKLEVKPGFSLQLFWNAV